LVNLNIGVIIITKDRPQMVRRLVDSIVKGGLGSFSLILIDDSNSHNFLQTRDFLKSYSIQSMHISSLQAEGYVEKTLEETNLTVDEKRFVRNCTGLQSPFDDFVERFFNQNEPRVLPIRLGLRFAPYSVARNLGIYCAVCFFNPDVILFLDDDCLILYPEKLKTIIQLIEAKINGRKIVALAGIYKEISVFKPKVVAFEGSTLRRVLEVMRGMDAFLRRSLAVQKERFNLMPPHMLGGALLLNNRVFRNLPFDPYIARGEDHAYARDIRSLLDKNEIAVRDNQFAVGHEKAEISKNHEEMNVLRDIFRFVYLHAKTGQWSIPLFIARWSLVFIIQVFLNPSEYVQCKNQLLALIFYAPRFAKENACKFRLNLKAWTTFLSQSQIRNSFKSH
jgi:glycosyltransferase involved in cell wall biosynthesis